MSFIFGFPLADLLLRLVDLVYPSRKHAYKILTPLNPTFI